MTKLCFLGSPKVNNAIEDYILGSIVVGDTFTLIVFVNRLDWRFAYGVPLEIAMPPSIIDLRLICAGVGYTLFHFMAGRNWNMRLGIRSAEVEFTLYHGTFQFDGQRILIPGFILKLCTPDTIQLSPTSFWPPKLSHQTHGQRNAMLWNTGETGIDNGDVRGHFSSRRNWC